MRSRVLTLTLRLTLTLTCVHRLPTPRCARRIIKVLSGGVESSWRGLELGLGWVRVGDSARVRLRVRDRLKLRVRVRVRVRDRARLRDRVRVRGRLDVEDVVREG